MSSVPRVLTLICLAASLTLAGCATETARKGGAASKGPVEYCRPAIQAPELVQTAPSGPATPAVAAAADPAVRAAAAPAAPDGADIQLASFTPLDQLFFDFDSYILTPSARSTLDLVYEKLGGSEGSYTLEGHCDERGDDEYNLALGERRAAAARAYLISRGLRAERLRTISYGRDFPADPARTEEAYQRNRRVEVVDAAAPGPNARYGAGK